LPGNSPAAKGPPNNRNLTPAVRFAGRGIFSRRETIWQFYDVEGRPTSKTFADSSEVLYTYENTTSRLKAITDAKQQVTNYTYYTDDGLAGVTYTGTNGASLSPATPGVSYTYDPVYNRLSAMADATGTTTYSYNPVSSSPADWRASRAPWRIRRLRSDTTSSGG
jgi:YD repeat-containing protein